MYVDAYTFAAVIALAAAIGGVGTVAGLAWLSGVIGRMQQRKAGA